MQTIKMLAEYSILFIMLTIVGRSESKIIEKVELFDNGKWKDELNFWGRTTCRAGTSRSFTQHAIISNDDNHKPTSKYLEDFLEALVIAIQTECDGITALLMQSYYEYSPNDTTIDTSHFSIDNEDQTLDNDPPKIIDETSNTKVDSEMIIFPNEKVEIAMIMLEDIGRVLLNRKFFENWDNRRHVIVVIVPKTMKFYEFSNILRDRCMKLLQRLWKERKVFNVFIAAPFTNLGRRFWFYDPFFKNETSGVRGKIFAVGVRDISSVDRVKDLRAYTLNIGLFEVPPIAIKYNSSFLMTTIPYNGLYIGMDGITMHTISQYMNFKMEIIAPTDGMRFGYVSDNGTYFGTIGDAAYHRIDIGFNSMYLKFYAKSAKNVQAIQFTNPLSFDQLCVVVPRAPKVPRWLRTFYYFHPAIWICIILNQITVSFVWYIIRNFINQIRESSSTASKKSYRSLLVDTFIIFVGAPLNNLKISHIERIIVASLLMFGLTIMGIFTGTLYHNFTNEMYYKEMNTLKEVDASGINVTTGAPNLQDVFGVDDDNDAEEVVNLRNKLQIISLDGIEHIHKTAHDRNVASLARLNTFSFLNNRYIDDTGASLIHLVPECPRSYYLSYVLPKDSIYVKRLDELIRRLQESGLPTLWDSVTTRKLIHNEQMTNKDRLHKVKSSRASFNMTDMQTSFFLLFIGNSIAVCTFILELVYYKKLKILKIISEMVYRHR